LTGELRPGDLERFRELVGRRLGLRFDDERLGQLADVLRSRLVERSQPAEAYLGELGSAGSARDEVRALARDLTVGETYFFRNIEQFRALVDVVVPELVRARSDSRRLRILSAGCASGEEPYTLAILLSERMSDPSWSVFIRGVDIDPAALARAREGRYSAWALRETPAESQRRWFQPRGRDHVLADAPRHLVSFEERNLAEEDADLWPPSFYDVVFCRNVLMYFTPERALALVGRIAASLRPQGYLFLGHAETLRGLSHEFNLLHTHATFYYRRRQTPPPPARPDVARAPGRPEPSSIPLDGTGTWIEVIQRAADRIHALANAHVPAPGAAPRARRWDLGSALELLKAERFAEALDRVQGLPPEAATDPEVLLLRATLLTHNGKLDEAEQACDELIRIDEMNAGAHYLLALCREGRGDAAGALHHDQLAAYLDPEFAMPRLHMGLVARREGDREGACRQLSEALELLRREEASRLLLFGGGFSREALAGLCRAELVACGGTA
jgi:chemotaxis protein methyltransferase CheR